MYRIVMVALVFTLASCGSPEPAARAGKKSNTQAPPETDAGADDGTADPVAKPKRKTAPSTTKVAPASAAIPSAPATPQPAPMPPEAGGQTTSHDDRRTKPKSKKPAADIVEVATEDDALASGPSSSPVTPSPTPGASPAAAIEQPAIALRVGKRLPIPIGFDVASLVIDSGAEFFRVEGSALVGVKIGTARVHYDSGAQQYTQTLTIGAGASGLFAGAGMMVPARLAQLDDQGRTTAAWTSNGLGTTGGARVAAGDVDGDGRIDLVAAPGPAGGQTVKIYLAKDGMAEAAAIAFTAFADGWNFGLNIALGDLNDDGYADIIVGADAGGEPRVAVWDGKTAIAGTPQLLLASLLVYDYSGSNQGAWNGSFKGGVRVAAGDVDCDGRDDLIAAAGPGGSPQVRVYLSGRNGAPLGDERTLAYDFQAGNGSSRKGLFVAAGPLLGENHCAEVVVANDMDAEPRVTVYGFDDGAPRELASALVFDGAFSGGVRVAVGDVDGDGHNDLVAGSGHGGNGTIRTFSSGAITSAPTATFLGFTDPGHGCLFVAAAPLK